MKRNGFTLIELMVVMAILAILLGLGAGSFITAQKKGRDNTRKSNLRAIANALELYYNDKGKYPASDASGGIVGCGADAAPTACSVNGVFSDANGTIYMPQLPTDPAPAKRYYYLSAGASQFQIYASLENAQDPTLIVTAYNCASGSGSSLCNWGISSANVNP